MDFLSSISAQQHLLPPVIFITMITIGMELRIEQFRALLAAPRTPVVGTIIHSLTFPVLAIAAVLLTELVSIAVSEAIVIGVLLIAACPSGGFSNVLTLIAKANLPLSIVLTAVSSILSFLTVPLLIGGFGLFVAELQGEVSLPILQILAQLAVLVLAPIVIGMWLSRALPSVTPDRLGRLQRISQLLLYVVVALLIIENWPIMAAGLVDAMPWSVGLCVSNIALCFSLSRWSGLENEDAITVSLEGSVRNIGVAFLIAANTLNRPDIAVLPTVYFLSVIVFSILFARYWRSLPGFAGR